jgi:nitroreductase
MDVTAAIALRRSVRGFLSRPVSQDILEGIFRHAQRAPSNCNVQPWQVIVASGKRKQALSDAYLGFMGSNLSVEPDPDFGPTMLSRYEGLHKQRQHGSAAALYGAMNIARDDRDGRKDASLRNWTFFDAPHVAFFTMDKSLGMKGAVDMGIYAQTLALLMTERNVGSCFQASLGYFTKYIHELLSIPENMGILFGMSFGFIDPACSANKCQTGRADFNDAVVFLS